MAQRREIRSARAQHDFLTGLLQARAVIGADGTRSHDENLHCGLD
jgi:hypothetical protein